MKVIEALQTGQKDIESSLAKLNTTCVGMGRQTQYNVCVVGGHFYMEKQTGAF